MYCVSCFIALWDNAGSFSKVRISARISCSFHPSSETLWKLLWNSTRRRRRRRRDSRRPARWPLLAGHYQRTITGPRLWIAKKETEFSNHALYDRLCTEKLNHFWEAQKVCFLLHYSYESLLEVSSRAPPNRPDLPLPVPSSPNFQKVLPSSKPPASHAPLT